MRPPDSELRQAIGELKAAVLATPTGRVFVELHTLDGVVIERRLHRDRCTESEFVVLMASRPCPRLAAAELGKGRRK